MAEYRLLSAVQIQPTVGVEAVTGTVHVQIAAVDIDVVIAGWRWLSAGASSAAGVGMKGIPSAATARIGAVAAAAGGVHAVIACNDVIASRIDVDRAGLQSLVGVVDRHIGIPLIAALGPQDQ